MKYLYEILAASTFSGEYDFPLKSLFFVAYILTGFGFVKSASQIDYLGACLFEIFYLIFIFSIFLNYALSFSDATKMSCIGISMQNWMRLPAFF